MVPIELNEKMTVMQSVFNIVTQKFAFIIFVYSVLDVKHIGLVYAFVFRIFDNKRYN